MEHRVTKRPTPSHQTTHFGSPPLCFLPHSTGHLCHPVTYAMMNVRMRTETEHQAEKTGSGLCRSGGSGADHPAPAGPAGRRAPCWQRPLRSRGLHLRRRVARLTPEAARGGSQEGTWGRNRDEVEMSVDTGAGWIAS